MPRSGIIAPHNSISGRSGSLTHTIAGFCGFLREHGFTVGVGETLDALEAARQGTLQNRQEFMTALRSLLCTDRQEFCRFGELFDAYWKGSLQRKHTVRQKGRTRAVTRSIPLLLLGSQAQEAEESGKDTHGASAAERLRRTDFSKVAVDDQDQLEALAARLFRLMSLRLSRHLKASLQKEKIDLRRTIRRSIPYGGTPIDLAHRARKLRRPHLTALLDVSASMDRYSFFLLRFIHALGRHFGRVDSFLFSTRLRCITRELQGSHVSNALPELAGASDAWQSGTRIGASLEAFNEHFSRQALSRNTVVLVLSDGLDTGEPNLLARQIQKIKLRSKKLLWLNPLLGMEGYEPLTRGIQCVLPHVDQFLPAHNLESLLCLETHLRHA